MPKILVALLTLLVLAGCSSSPEKAPAEEAADKSGLPEFDAQADIRIRWRTQLGDGSGSNYIRLQPAVQNDTLYAARSEEHTSELQSRENLVCRLLLEKKKQQEQQH